MGAPQSSQAAVSESETRAEAAPGLLESLLAGSKDCIKILSLEGKLLYVSGPGQVALEIDDVSLLIGRPWTEFWTGIDREAAQEVVAEARAGRTGSFEGFLPTFKGDPRWWDVVVSPIFGPSGQPEKLLSISRDITRRKKSEEALRASEAMFRSLANEIPDICCILAPGGNVIWSNQRWTEYTGLTPEQTADRGWEQAHTNESRNSLARFIDESVAKGEPFERVHQIRGRNGHFGWFLTRAIPVKDDGGQVVRWFCTATNIDDIIQTEEEQKRLFCELKHVNRELQDFAHLLSHDLQTYVRAILTFSELLTRDAGRRLQPDDIECLDSIKQAARQMHQLIRTVLDYSVVGAKSLSFHEVDLEQVVDTLATTLRPVLEESGAVLTVDPLPTVWGDAVLLRQLLQNLLSNAIKYHRAGVPPHIEVAAERRGRYWMIRVSDDGIGIPPRDHERIFAPLQRLHDDTIPGTGFGLTLCRRIAERHGGRIWVESDIDAGATFCFTVPAAAIHATAASAGGSL